MKKHLIKAVFTLNLLFLGFPSLLAQNQFPSEFWYQGRIYGTDGQTHTGLVKYDLENNVVQLKSETISTFTAFNVSNFEIQNKTNEGMRSFYSLPYSPTGDENNPPIFFEVLTEGKEISLLSREYVETNYSSTGSKGINGPTNDGHKVKKKYRLAFDYFFFKDYEIQKYSLLKKDLLDFFPAYQDEINQFMKKNKLDHDKRRDLISITAYYNELKN